MGNQRLRSFLSNDQGSNVGTGVLSRASGSWNFQLLYTASYVGLMLVSFLDIAFTWVILNRGGSEMNPVADLVIRSTGLAGLISFKFTLLVVLVLLCEFIGRQRPRICLWLPPLLVVIWGLPPLWSIIQLLNR